MVRGRDDNTIGEPRLPAAIVRQERMRNHQGRRIFVPWCDHHLDSVCRQHLKRGCAGRDRQRLGVASQKQRAIGSLAFSFGLKRWLSSPEISGPSTGAMALKNTPRPITTSDITNQRAADVTGTMSPKATVESVVIVK
jgi:hypothetical protein